MSILDSFDTDVNFWEHNPQLRYVENFSELHKGDKSRGKADSSQLMWAIALLMDKSKNNNFRNMPEEERRFQLAKYFLKDDKFSWENPKIRTLIDTYEKCIMTQPMRSIRNLEEKMKERDVLIQQTPYNMDTAEELDKMIIGTHKIIQLYKQMNDLLMLEEETKDNSKTKYTSEI